MVVVEEVVVVVMVFVMVVVENCSLCEGSGCECLVVYGCISD